MRLLAEDIAGERGGNILFSKVDFDLSPGEGLVVTGPNGAGKSTLLRILAGLLRPSAGTFGLIDDAGDPAQDAMHFLSAHNAMKDALTCRENLSFWKDFLPDHESGKGVSPDDALSALQLPHVSDLPFGYLSTGQRRRVAIARLLASHRPLWLVDEPTAGLDKASEALFADIAATHLKSGGILVAATHLPLGISGLQHLVIGGET
ncbi:MAG: heme ABC exporter ATP-binding protein CcmA [Rhizobiaceae bacterium]